MVIPMHMAAAKQPTPMPTVIARLLGIEFKDSKKVLGMVDTGIFGSFMLGMVFLAVAARQ
ncbi:hypothetical protein EON65_51305 [archaeon]|nr:MAG: hypothetical protein EON65_51305 [archaeon]